MMSSVLTEIPGQLSSPGRDQCCTPRKPLRRTKPNPSEGAGAEQSQFPPEASAPNKANFPQKRRRRTKPNPPETSAPNKANFVRSRRYRTSCGRVACSRLRGHVLCDTHDRPGAPPSPSWPQDVAMPPVPSETWAPNKAKFPQRRRRRTKPRRLIPKRTHSTTTGRSLLESSLRRGL
jgi:hypothetical protein